MAYASTAPPEITKLLNQLRERHPDWHWTYGPEIGVENGHYLQASNNEVMRHVVFKDGADIVELADKLVKPIKQEDNL